MLRINAEVKAIVKIKRTGDVDEITTTSGRDEHFRIFLRKRSERWQCKDLTLVCKAEDRQDKE